MTQILEMTQIRARAGAKHGRGRSNSSASSRVSVDDDEIQGADSHQSNGERATNFPQSSSGLPSKSSKRGNESMGDTRNALLVVATLIASTTYQAVIHLPGFIMKVDNNNSTKGFPAYYASMITSPLGRDFAYIVFMSGNTLGFLVSVQTMTCLTRDLPVRLPLLLSVAAMVQTYYCFTNYLPFTLQDRAFGLKNVELLSMLPATMSILLLLAQRRLALALDFCVERLSRLNLLGDMYSLGTQSDANSKILNEEKESIGDIRNALLVVAALIVSATYQAVLQPPSFKIKVHDNTTKGFLAYYASWVTRPIGRDFAYIGFISGNTFGLLVSIQMIICLTRDLPVRLPLLLSVTALFQTYYCFTYYLPFALLDKSFGLINVELLSVLPITMSILLLLAQRWLAQALDFWLERLSCFNLLEDMYSLRTQYVSDREAGAEHRRGRSNSPPSRPPSEEDQSSSHSPSKNLNKEKESMGDIRNTLLVVAALIASATYQAVYQPPSFPTKVHLSSTKGFLASYASWMTGPLGRDLAYIAFMSSNTFGLLVSVQMIICLTKDLPIRPPLLLSMTPIRLLLLLSMTAMVQTYHCFTYFLPFTSLDKEFGLKNVELLSVLPVTMSLLLLLAQRRLALALDFWVERLSRLNLLGDMYSLGTQSDANSKILNKERESIGNTRNALLTVATLVANATYQAVLQPPSFRIKVNDNSTKGFLAHYASWVTGLLGKDVVYIGFISGNTLGLLLSIQMIICLTRDLPVRLPLLLFVTALVQTYYCLTYYLPFALLDKAFGLINVELLSVLPIPTSILLLLAQRWLALAVDFWLERLSWFNLLGDMYSLRTQSVDVNDIEAVAEHGRGSNSPASRPPLEEDQSDVEPVTNAPQSENLNEEKESMGDKRTALLVVAALIASTTYQAVLQPPSFTTKVDSNFTKGFLAYYASGMTRLLGRDVAYIAFMSGNTFGLLLSIQMIICLTRDLPVKLPLLLSMTAMVQTYYCITCYLLFTLLDKAFGLKKGKLLSVLPLATPILLLLIQRRLALALDFAWKGFLGLTS